MSGSDVLGVRVVLLLAFHLLVLLLSCLRCCLESGPASNNEARLLPFFEAGVDSLQVGREGGTLHYTTYPSSARLCRPQ